MSEERNVSHPVVNTYNEWDPLEEIIIGIVEGALIPPWDLIMEATLYKKEPWDFYSKFGGIPPGLRI